MITRKVAVAPWCAMFMGLILYAAMTSPATAAISIAITNFRGDWDPTVHYGAGALVTYNGQSYIAIVKNNNVVPTETDAWAILDAQGAQGPQGPAGAAGAPGPAGPAGPAGAMGIAGAAGAQGPVGPAGVQGPIGNTGAQGAPGPQGPIGLTGSPGAPGTNGVNGTGAPTCAASDAVVSYQGALVCASSVPRYVANGDGTLTDNQTGLMWEMQTSTCSGEVTCYSNSYLWTSTYSLADGTLFTSFIAGLNGGDYYSPSDGQDVNAGPGSCFAKHCDWRIPTIAELQTIIETTASGCGSGSPCIDPAFGPTQAGNFWSSSAVLNFPQNAWVVYFYDGRTFGAGGVGEKISLYQARAVRSGR